MYLITQPRQDAGRIADAGRFTLRRVLRILPLFWLSMILTLWTGRGTPPPDVWAWTRQLFLIDFPLPQPVGWTLVFEIRFYVLVAVIVMLFRDRKLGFAALAAFLVLVSQVWPTAETMTSPIMLEFVMGIAVAAVCQSGIRLPASLLLLGAVGWFLYASVWLYPTIEINTFRWYGFGPPAALLLCATMMLERDGKLRTPSLALAAGNASYSTYLWHLGLIGVLSSFWSRSPQASIVYLFTLLFLTAVVSAVSYRLIERPLNVLSKRRRESGELHGALKTGLPQRLRSGCERLPACGWRQCGRMDGRKRLCARLAQVQRWRLCSAAGEGRGGEGRPVGRTVPTAVGVAGRGWQTGP